MLKNFIIPAFFASVLLVCSCTGEERKVDTNIFDFSVEEAKTEQVMPEKSVEKQGLKEEKTAVEAAQKTPKKQEDVAQKIEEKVQETVPSVEKSEEEKVKKASELIPSFTKKYNIRYLSFDVANIVIDGSKKGYLRIFSKTNGFIDYLFGWRDYTISNFKIAEKRVVPHDFKTKLLFKKKVREIEVRYGEDGKHVTFEQVTPPDNRLKRPEVEDSLKRAVYDPLTAAIEARRLAMEAVKDGNFSSKGWYNFSLPIYEGRRRTDLMFSLSNKKIDGTYMLKLHRKPIAGYTNNELDEIKKGDAVIDIYLDSKTFIPVKAEGRNFLGVARASFVADCNNFEECAK